MSCRYKHGGCYEVRVSAEFYVENETRLPYHIHYGLSSFLYRCIRCADEELGTWLHEEGIAFQGRSYKPIHFSHPFFEQRKHERDCMVVQGKMVLQIGSILPEIIHRLVEGLWKVRHLSLHDVLIPLAGVQIVPPVEFSKNMSYRAISPVVVPIVQRGRLHYCHPLESRFYDALRQSLRNWYHIRWKEPLGKEEEIHLSLSNPARFQLRRAAVLTRYKEKNIKGYQVPLLLEAPPKVQQVAYEAGLGSYGSQGFGMIEVMDRKGASLQPSKRKGSDG